MLATYNQVAEAIFKDVAFYGDGSTTIKVGMPVCYYFDATANWLDYDPQNDTYLDGTTAEGYHNEGKYIFVKAPATDNLLWFAGVVSENSPNLEVTTTSGKYYPIQIQIPNGAIGLVRAAITTVVGKSALAIMNGQTYFGNPNAGMGDGAARYVAVAQETVIGTTSAPVLTLARICPSEFLYQSLGSTKMQFATAGTVNVAANFINVDSAQTSGEFTALFVRSNTSTAGGGDTALAIYGEANVNGVVAGSYCIANRASLNLWGGTQTASHIHAFCAEIYEEGANLTGGTYISPLMLRTQIDATNPPAANSHWMITCRCDGADKPDGLLIAVSADAIKFAAKSSAAVSHTVPIRVAGTTYYLMVSDAA